MSAKEPQPMPEMFKRNREDGQAPMARPKPSAAPPALKSAKKSPTFSMLKSIIMDYETLTTEQKLGLIDKIGELY